ncbi:MAG: hypothetical protein HY332_17900 [Chloroflexi bacterium]|nr:hypothetical protein [Chloroflexota bacterium]
MHRAERERGLDYLDDLYSIGTIECELAPGAVLLVAPSVEPPDVVRRRLAELAKTTAGRCGPPLPLGEAARRAGEGSGAPSRGDSKAAAALTLALSQRERGRGSSPTSDRSEEEFLAQLRRAASQFLVTRAVPGEPAVVGPGGLPEARTVLAGYHWFGDWGRDTMIALPGLALATGRYAEARAILRAFARYVDRGMLPNRFPDTGVPLGDGDYNTVDASLWYFHAIDAIGHASLDASEADGDLVAELFPVLADIVDWHVRGTRFGIGVDPADGLVRVADPQLTWMDAKVGEWVMTPRAGKTVEIAALWIHALGLMERWADRLRRSPEASRYRELLRQAAGGFGTRFWYGDGGYLYDLLDGESGGDASLRPNQIIAAALPDCPLTPEQRRAVVDGVVERLWTPRGLRTLAPDDPRYRGRYQGDPRQRDGAYHQGTVWPWLLGPLVDAHLVVYRDPAAARRLVEPMRAHLFDEAGVGSISEIFDGDPPHAARGCIAQAWSVSEVYRAWMATAVGSRQ